ncbi:MAG TPA: hypothetical protein VHE12_08305 [bacterium]|nr:hypothetical protein [bacterium]
MTTDRLNYLNILLMVLSAGLALMFPFELFLFSYGVLGPLHYLTEISWLHDRDFYVKGRSDPWVLLAIAALITLLFLGAIPQPSGGGWGEALVTLSFWIAFGSVALKDHPSRWLLAGAGALALFLFGLPFPLKIAFGMFLPTLVHVFLFTGIFILLGALKGRSLSGILSLAVFGAMMLLFLWVHPGASYSPSPYVQDSYGVLTEGGGGTSPFILINRFLAHRLGFPGSEVLTGGSQAANHYLYSHPAALSLMAFIAFAYTYHYLNWFSKTSVIGWHEIPRRRAWVILALWALSIGLYAWNYLWGLKWLFFLSFAHVLLEFPLDQLTFLSIGRELVSLARLRDRAARGR